MDEDIMKQQAVEEWVERGNAAEDFSMDQMAAIWAKEEEQEFEDQKMVCNKICYRSHILAFILAQEIMDNFFYFFYLLLQGGNMLKEKLEQIQANKESGFSKDDLLKMINNFQKSVKQTAKTTAHSSYRAIEPGMFFLKAVDHNILAQDYG